MEKKISEKVPGSDFYTTDHLRYIKFLPESQFGSLDDFYPCSHYAPSPKKTSTMAVTTTLTTAMGNSPFQPRLISWS